MAMRQVASHRAESETSFQGRVEMCGWFAFKTVPQGKGLDLIVDALFQSMLVRPEAAVSGGQLLLHALRNFFIECHGKLGHVVPAHCRATLT